MISYCGRLKEIKLGSHADASLTAVGSAGGDLFAKTLSEKCQYVNSADLTGMISMTDSGWTHFMRTCGERLQKLVIRRAMQISLELFGLVSLCSNLKRLTFANVPHINDDVIIGVVTNIGHQLSFLQLESIPITDRTLTCISQCCFSLVQLRVYQCKRWETFETILYASRLEKLRYLVIHGCSELKAAIQCVDLSEWNLSMDMNSDSPPISDKTYISHSSIIPHPLTSTLAISSIRREQDCQISLDLQHLEIVECDMLGQDQIGKMLLHLKLLNRFIYVGEALDLKIHNMISTRRNIKFSIYATQV
jgi:hypothetical protein